METFLAQILFFHVGNTKYIRKILKIENPTKNKNAVFFHKGASEKPVQPKLQKPKKAKIIAEIKSSTARDLDMYEVFIDSVSFNYSLIP